LGARFRRSLATEVALELADATGQLLNGVVEGKPLSTSEF